MYFKKAIAKPLWRFLSEIHECPSLHTLTDKVCYQTLIFAKIIGECGIS